MDVVDHQDLTGRLEREVLGPGHDGAGLVDLEERARALDLHQVGVGPAQRPTAHGTVAASAIGTEKGGGQSPGRRALARPRGAVQEVSVHGPATGGAQGADRPRLTDHLGEQRRNRNPGRVVGWASLDRRPPTAGPGLSHGPKRTRAHC